MSQILVNNKGGPVEPSERDRTSDRWMLVMKDYCAPFRGRGIRDSLSIHDPRSPRRFRIYVFCSGSERGGTALSERRGEWHSRARWFDPGQLYHRSNPVPSDFEPSPLILVIGFFGVLANVFWYSVHGV